METAGDVHVAKRLGIAVKGEIFQGHSDDSARRPEIKVGSLFSNMAQLPKQNFASFDMNFAEEFEFIKSKPFHRGLLLNTNG